MASYTGEIQAHPIVALLGWWRATAMRLHVSAARLVARLPGRRRVVELALVALAVFAIATFLLVLGTESHHRR